MSGDRDAIACSLHAAGLATDRFKRERLSGGCIDQVERIILQDGFSVVAKIGSSPNADRFKAEQRGLEVLSATQTVRVPRVFGCLEHESTCVLLLEHLEATSASSAMWIQFGEELAALHQVDMGSQYGFEADNYLGSTTQLNGWHDDWVEFNRVCRIEPQLRMAEASGVLTGTDLEACTSVLGMLIELLPSHPRPSLLHGDLWGGNVLPCADGSMAVIDPACSVGDGYADIAMMRLFGGFPEVCFKAYFALQEEPLSDIVERRMKVYQIYHMLNHVNIFGTSYLPQLRALIGALT